MDCRNINDKLHKFKFKYEDMQIARQLLEKGSYMFAFDIRGAYNHIDIFHQHRTFLGISWFYGDKEVFYVYNSLPFGLASAGHIFSKVLRVLVTFWRSNGHRVVTFLDDGLGGSHTYEQALLSSKFVEQSLVEFGFLLSIEKCQWQPSLQITWLGYFICMKTGKFCITSERTERIEKTILSMFLQLSQQQYQILPAKFAASVVGQIISTQLVIGKVVRLKTREMYKCIDSRLSWRHSVYISKKAMLELKFWLSNIRILNGKGQDIKENSNFHIALFADASGNGYGGYIRLRDYNKRESDVLVGNCWSPEVDTEIENDSKQLASPEAEVLCNHSVLRSVSPEVEHIAQTSFSSSEVEVFGKSPMMQTYAVSPEVETDSSPEVELVCKPDKLVRRVFPEVDISAKKQTADRYDSIVSKSVAADESMTVIKHQISNSKGTEVGFEVIGAWSSCESGKSSTWRETETVRRVMQSNINAIRGKKVKVYSDNKNVKSVLKSGSKREELQIIASEVSDICDTNEIELSVEWIPRHLYESSDYLSRCKDNDDWSVEDWVFQTLNRRWGPHTIDRFASYYNCKCPRYNSRWWVPGTEGVNSLDQYWGLPEINWAVPPPRLIPSV